MSIARTTAMCYALVIVLLGVRRVASFRVDGRVRVGDRIYNLTTAPGTWHPVRTAEREPAYKAVIKDRVFYHFFYTEIAGELESDFLWSVSRQIDGSQTVFFHPRDEHVYVFGTYLPVSRVISVPSVYEAFVEMALAGRYNKKVSVG